MSKSSHCEHQHPIWTPVDVLSAPLLIPLPACGLGISGEWPKAHLSSVCSFDIFTTKVVLTPIWYPFSKTPLCPCTLQSLIVMPIVCVLIFFKVPHIQFALSTSDGSLILLQMTGFIYILWLNNNHRAYVLHFFYPLIWWWMPCLFCIFAVMNSAAVDMVGQPFSVTQWF